MSTSADHSTDSQEITGIGGIERFFQDVEHSNAWPTGKVEDYVGARQRDETVQLIWSLFGDKFKVIQREIHPATRMTPNEPGNNEEFDPQSLRFVGPKTAAILADAPFAASGLVDRTVSYRMLIDEGVNFGVAAKIRREHSLHWSFGNSDGLDLAERSKHVRGLQDEEREWIAASQGDWEQMSYAPSAETDGSGSVKAAEAAWRDRSRPTPVDYLPGIDHESVERLKQAGIRSIRSLAAADPERVSDALELDVDQVAGWCQTAKDALE